MARGGLFLASPLVLAILLNAPMLGGAGAESVTP